MRRISTLLLCSTLRLHVMMIISQMEQCLADQQLNGFNRLKLNPDKTDFLSFHSKYTPFVAVYYC